MAVVIKRKLKKKFMFLIIFFVLLLFVAGFALFFVLSMHDGKIEVGSKAKINNFVISPFTKVCKLQEKTAYDKVGKYDVQIVCMKVPFKKKVEVVDTTSPEVVVKKFTTYKNEYKPENFIESVIDATGYKTSLEGTVDFANKEEQKLTLVVTDDYGNETRKEVILQFSNDENAPKISGISNITIMENEKVDYNKGVKAVDEIDGECKFSVDSSKVDTKNAGTYYAIYSATDLSGNTATVKRKIVVVKKDDTTELLADFYNKYLAGKSVREMAIVIRKKISYAHKSGGDDPVYFGLKNRTGSCKVHALLFKSVLDYAGYENMIVYNLKGTHMWNLVYEDGHWRHYDATPGNADIGPNTDKEIENSINKYKKWDKSKYPKAE